MVKKFDNVDMIVVDGGPNGGKSSGMSCIAAFLSSNGYPVASTPEAASEVMMQGMRQKSFDDPKIFQRMIMKRVMDNEELFGYGVSELARKTEKGKGFLLCDRGIMSALAYMKDHKMFEQLLREHDLTMEGVRHKRYAQIVHLRSTACGLPKLYEKTRKNNPVRTENAKQARALDQRIINAWEGHHDLTIIHNTNDAFDAKMEMAVGAIAHRIGLPTPLNIEKKYLVDNADVILPKNATVAYIRQFYLKDDLYVREMRFSQGTTLYFKTVKSCTASQRRFKSEQIIDHKEFTEILLMNTARVIPYLEKERYFFAQNGQYYRLDRFLSMIEPLVILEVQPTSAQQKIVLPSSLKIMEEVTDNPAYYNYFIAQRQARR